eukprot:scaffold76621_cov84-Phaeocystis_antarctica.AAC.1
MVGHVEGEDSTETAVLNLTKKEEVAESSSSPARRSATPLARGRHVRAPANGLRERARRDEHAAVQQLRHTDDQLVASVLISRSGSNLDVIWLSTSTPGASGSCPSRTVPYRCCSTTVHKNVPRSKSASFLGYPVRPDRGGDGGDGGAGAPPGAAQQRATQRQDNGVADNVACHFAYHFAGHGSTRWRRRSRPPGRCTVVWIASSPVHREVSMCSGASSVVWEAAAQRFQVIRLRAAPVLAPDLPRRPLLPRPHLLAGGVARHDHFHSWPWRACVRPAITGPTRASSVYVDADPHTSTW